MTRVKGGIKGRRRHKKILKATKGYQMTKSRLYKVAKEAFLHAGDYAYRHRKSKKRDFRRLWITRLNAAVRAEGVTYSKFLAALKKTEIILDRKILSILAVEDPETFKKILEKVKENIS